MPNFDDTAQPTPDHDEIAESSAQRQDQNVLLELCVGGIDDVVLAAEFDLDRIELNCGMALGGLTPSSGLLQEARIVFRRPIIAMLRPREGGFCYSRAEYAQMLRDTGRLIDNGADGIAVGFLTADGAIDRARCQDFRVRFPRATLVFHRAFDVLQDLHLGLSQLIEHGWQRILTSGGHSTALQGASVLCELNHLAAGRIEILPGGGIRPRNLRELVQQTEIHQVHTALTARGLDLSTQHRPDLRFGSSDAPGENGAYAMVSRQLLKELLSLVRPAEQAK